MLEAYLDNPLFRKFMDPIIDEGGKIVGWDLHAPGMKEVRVEDPNQNAMLTLELLLEKSREKLAKKLFPTTE